MLPPMYTALMYTVSCPQDQKERVRCPPSAGKSEETFITGIV
jgi:hypothetical protein